MLGPQKEPSSIARIRAQWKQVNREHQEAVLVRKQWMKILGYSDKEIANNLKSAFDLTLLEELEQLELAICRSTTID